MDKQQVREKAAAFLDEIREGVAKILQDPNKGFDFAKYVSKWDETHSCGTVCCMEGWIPAIRPDLAHYGNLNQFIYSTNGFNFEPQFAGIPISLNLWEALIVPGDQTDIPIYAKKEYDLTIDSKFNEVSYFWILVASDIRDGKLDEYLLFDLN